MFRTSDILFFKIQYLCTQQKGLTSKDDDVVGVSVFFFFILKKKKRRRRQEKQQSQNIACQSLDTCNLDIHMHCTVHLWNEELPHCLLDYDLSKRNIAVEYARFVSGTICGPGWL